MPFEIIPSRTKQVPVLISVPHSGTKIPDPILEMYDTEMVKKIDDTDWYVDHLYDFAGSLGIKMIKATYSRWVIDLNRTSDNTPLYDDGRVITELCPTTDFNGEKIYSGQHPNQKEISRRMHTYYTPYYEQIYSEITELKKKYDHVLFFDAHSIRSCVLGIRQETFPDLILGDVDETSASPTIVSVASNLLCQTSYSFSHNDPFKGGHLTRTFGCPENGIHALQLEMAKSIYMKNNETTYDTTKAEKIKKELKHLFENLIQTLKEMNK